MEGSTSVYSAAWFRFSPADRTAIAAALIVGIVLVSFLHAPLGAVLGGCGLSLVGIFINSRRKRR